MKKKTAVTAAEVATIRVAIAAAAPDIAGLGPGAGSRSPPASSSAE